MAIGKELKTAIESHGLKVYGNNVMVDGELYPVPLVQGNTKLGETVYHGSTLPTNETITTKKDGQVLTEPGTCPTTCRECYGTKGRFKYDSTKFYLMMRTRLLRRHPVVYFLLVDLQLTFENVEKLRIHATGDFIPGEARGYYNVLLKHPDVRAWTYTKCEVSGDIALLDSLPNCNVVPSIIPGKGFNYGHVPYVAMLYWYLRNKGESVYICRCSIDPNQHCSNCDGCSEHRYVLFAEHSTGYIPAKDFGYEKFVELVESQQKKED